MEVGDIVHYRMSNWDAVDQAKVIAKCDDTLFVQHTKEGATGGFTITAASVIGDDEKAAIFTEAVREAVLYATAEADLDSLLAALAELSQERLRSVLSPYAG